MIKLRQVKLDIIFNMLKNKATVDTIGHGTVSPEQRERNSKRT